MSRAPAPPRQKLSARVASALRSRLLAGEVPPGHKLPTEAQLTLEYGVSRTVVREAIATLAADGLVEARQGAGIFVSGHPAATFGARAAEMGGRVSTALNVLEVRLAIEVESAALAAARRTPSQLARIDEQFFEFDLLLRRGEPTAPADFEFHRAIAAATGNPVYVELLEALGQRAMPLDITSPWTTELVQSPDYQRGLQVEHRTILDAIMAGSPDAARAAMRTHLSRSQARYQLRLHERTAHFAAQDPGELIAPQTG